MSAPDQETMIAAARRIREQYPVDPEAKRKESDRQIRAQNEAIRAQLEEWGVGWSTTNEFGSTVEGRHIWHTALIEDRTWNTCRLGGRWGDNPTEVELHLRMYDEYGDHTDIEVIEDPLCTLYNKLKSDQIKTERAVRAVARKIEKTEAKYTDTKTTPELLEATEREGMLF